ncbi:MAG: hypothetical protein M1826_000725 [Phylliscum demangeonii]|nr:MAG: hypothetical protein M1826_000725 [Phylliscum demangeonii]
MSPLPLRPLGRDGARVSALGFGAMGLSVAYGAVASDEERFKVLDRCLELGVTFWDSADVYLDSEDLIGKWFKRTGKRDDIFLATKFAGTFVDGKFGAENDEKYIRATCEKSLKRLGIDCIDLYYCHRRPRARQEANRPADGDSVDGKTPIETTVKTMVELKNAGKIKYLGLSEVSSATLRRACKVHHIAAVQIEYSPFAMDIEDPQINLLKTCRELGVAVVAYSPLGRGMIGGQYRSRDDFEADDFRRIAPRFSDENFPKNLKLVDQLAALAKAKGVTASQLTLAWLLAQGDDIFPIPGTKKIKYLEENVAAASIHLTTAELAEIRQAIEAAEVHGERYPEMMMGSLFADTPPLS